MKPIEFTAQNVVYGKNQPEYLPLPAWRGGLDGEVTSCWQMNWRERLRVALTGRVYVTQLTFGNPLQPQRVAARFHNDGWLVALLIRIGLTRRTMQGDLFVPFHKPPKHAFDSWRTLWGFARFYGPFYTFRNLPGVIGRIPGRMLPRRWGFGMFGFEFGDRGG